jgi:hypothetical protein
MLQPARARSDAAKKESERKARVLGLIKMKSLRGMPREGLDAAIVPGVRQAELRVGPRSPRMTGAFFK